MPTNDKSEGDRSFRIALAKTVTTWALVAILAIATLIIVVAGINAIRVPEKEDQFFDIAKYVLGVLLPVIGAWVGTVLAFYFGQVNFEAASRSAANLVRQLSPREKLQAEAAGQAMMKINEVTTFKIPPDKTEADITMKELIDEGFEKDKSHPRQRLPFAGCPEQRQSRTPPKHNRRVCGSQEASSRREESTLSLKDLLRTQAERLHR